ncbi:site-specific integrase [Tsukamurella sp. 8F]|uniref:tyrosine-type recombinase/integrase n=1 Tax=unclassified Tsukamurella TaxID=2633480 RepID=UPI0023B9E816|nr:MULTISPECIES: site-specific integrase [unclassified Tsukamurella]MDF0529786.1 site-specific integrase [Tsukamurella sp. 8J]MDF0586978.1 site-specific integrase [Tsukamurella sp. 8F]
MTAGIRRRVARDGSVSWQVRFEVVDHEGRRRESSRTFPTRRDALAFKATRDRDRLAGADGAYNPLLGRTPLSEVWHHWAVAQERNVKAKTWWNTRSHWRLRVLPRWGAVAVGDITTSDVDRWAASLSVGAVSAGQSLNLLRRLLDQAVEDGRIRKNPARGVRAPRARQPERHQYLTIAQVNALAAACGEPGGIGYDVVVTLALCGLRWSELVALRVRDVDMAASRIYVRRAAVDVGGHLVVDEPKTRAGRRAVPLPALVKAVLEGRVTGRALDELVFTSPRGRMLRATNWRRSVSWNDAKTKANAELLTLHGLRHTYASLARRAGADLKTLQRTMGHSTIIVTADTYSDLYADEVDLVAQRLDELTQTGQEPDTTE